MARLLIKEVFIPPDRQRQKVNEAKVAELAISISTHGQLHPITVVALDRVRFPDAAPHLKYQLVAGYRRLLATALNKSAEIEGNFREDLNEYQQKEIELDENLRREELSWQDEVAAKKRLSEVRAKLYGDTVRDIAEHLGEAKTQTWEDVRLAKAIEAIPELANSKNKTQAMGKLRLLARRQRLVEEAGTVEERLSTDEKLQALTTKVFQGNCLEIVRGWENESIHCVVTDPPYAINLDKGETKKGNLHPEIYHDDTFDVIDLYRLVSKEAYRLLKDNTHAYFFFDIKQHGKILSILQDAGFVVDAIPLLWIKPGPGQVNHPDSRWASGYEAAFFCRKGTRALLKQGQSNVLAHDPVPAGRKIHPTEKPVSLLRQLIESSTVPGEIVLDFFGGSGSTAEAALQVGRDFRTTELDPAFYAGILERLSGATKSEPSPATDELGGTEDEAEEWN